MLKKHFISKTKSELIVEKLVLIIIEYIPIFFLHTFKT